MEGLIFTVCCRLINFAVHRILKPHPNDRCARGKGRGRGRERTSFIPSPHPHPRQFFFLFTFFVPFPLSEPHHKNLISEDNRTLSDHQK